MLIRECRLLRSKWNYPYYEKEVFSAPVTDQFVGMERRQVSSYELMEGVFDNHESIL